VEQGFVSSPLWKTSTKVVILSYRTDFVDTFFAIFQNMDYSLRTEDLLNILHKNTICSKKNLIQIYPLDLLPKCNNTNRMFIINTDVSSGKGKHWVSIYFPLHSLPEFFDSLGKCPSTYSQLMLDFLIENNSKGFIYNYSRLQNFHSSTCGLYCIYFLYYRIKGRTFEEILQIFSNNLQQNDMEVIKFYENIL